MILEATGNAAFPTSMKLARLKSMEQDRRDRSNALMRVMKDLAHSVTQCTTERLRELDSILCDLEATVAAQRIYDGSAKLAPDLDHLPCPSSVKPSAKVTTTTFCCPETMVEPPSSGLPKVPRVSFPVLSPGPAPRRVGFSGHDVVFQAPASSSPGAAPSPEGELTGTQSTKSTCFTPYTPAPFAVEDTDAEATVSPDKTSARAPDMQHLQQPGDGAAGGKQHGPLKPERQPQSQSATDAAPKLQLSDMMPFQPLYDGSSLAAAHGTSVVAMFEALRLLQTKLSAAVALVDRTVLPDLRTLRIRYFTCEERARGILDQTVEQLQCLMDKCEEEFQRISASPEQQIDNFDAPFFVFVRQLQTKLARAVSDTLDLVQQLNNAEAAASATFAQTGRAWNAHMQTQLQSLQQQIARLSPAFLSSALPQRTAAAGVATSDVTCDRRGVFASFPHCGPKTIAPDGDSEIAATEGGDLPASLTPTDSVSVTGQENFLPAAAAADSQVQQREQDTPSPSAGSPRWTPLAAVAADDHSGAGRHREREPLRQSSSFSEELSLSSHEGTGWRGEEEAPGAPLCGRSVRSLHSTFRPSAIPFWFAGDADVTAVSDARIERILMAAGDCKASRAPLAEFDAAAWRHAQEWLGATADGGCGAMPSPPPACGGALAQVFRLLVGEGMMLPATATAAEQQ